MTSDFVIIWGNAKEIFDAVNVLGMGLVGVWAVASMFLANAIAEKKDERILMTVTFLMIGGMIYFAGDPGKYILLAATVCTIIYGMFKILWKRKEFVYNE